MNGFLLGAIVGCGFLIFMAAFVGIQTVLYDAFGVAGPVGLSAVVIVAGTSLMFGWSK